jgi:prevent-host-death family protein
MSLVPVRELRNHTADVIERARSGEEITITVNDVPTLSLAAIQPAKKAFLTVEDLLALRPEHPVLEPHPHELWDDSTDDLGPIE